MVAKAFDTFGGDVAVFVLDFFHAAEELHQVNLLVAEGAGQRAGIQRHLRVFVQIGLAVFHRHAEQAQLRDGSHTAVAHAVVAEQGVFQLIAHRAQEGIAGQQRGFFAIGSIRVIGGEVVDGFQHVVIGLDHLVQLGVEAAVAARHIEAVRLVTGRRLGGSRFNAVARGRAARAACRVWRGVGAHLVEHQLHARNGVGDFVGVALDLDAVNFRNRALGDLKRIELAAVHGVPEVHIYLVGAFRRFFQRSRRIGKISQTPRANHAERATGAFGFAGQHQLLRFRRARALFQNGGFYARAAAIYGVTQLFQRAALEGDGGGFQVAGEVGFVIGERTDREGQHAFLVAFANLGRGVSLGGDDTLRAGKLLDGNLIVANRRAFVDLGGEARAFLCLSTIDVNRLAARINQPGKSRAKVRQGAFHLPIGGQLGGFFRLLVLQEGQRAGFQLHQLIDHVGHVDARANPQRCTQSCNRHLLFSFRARARLPHAVRCFMGSACVQRCLKIKPCRAAIRLAATCLAACRLPWRWPPFLPKESGG